MNRTMLKKIIREEVLSMLKESEEIDKEIASTNSEETDKVILSNDWGEENQNEYDTESLWEDLKDDLTALIEKRNPDGNWFAEAGNLGWRHQSGTLQFNATDGETFLRELLPKTNCTFNFYNLKGSKGFHIVNYHHDAPTGEYYNVHLLSEVISDEIKRINHINGYGEIEVGDDLATIQFWKNYDPFIVGDNDEELDEEYIESIHNQMIQKVKDAFVADPAVEEGKFELEDFGVIYWTIKFAE